MQELKRILENSLKGLRSLSLLPVYLMMRLLLRFKMKIPIKVNREIRDKVMQFCGLFLLVFIGYLLGIEYTKRGFYGMLSLIFFLGIGYFIRYLMENRNEY